MCGIAGVIKVHDPKDGPPPPHLEAIPEAWLDILDDSIKHRGPDGQGRFRDRATRDDGTIVDVALVHRRLSIIDHDGGSQPMVHDGNRLRPDLTYQPGVTPIIASEIEPNKPLVAVTFNGCIYNHRELRNELEAAGYVFETDHSDTEVLVHGWRESGLKLFQRLNAMACTIHWDSSINSLTVSRDRYGQKQIYERHLPQITTVFCSSPPGLWMIPTDELTPSQPTEHPLDSRSSFEIESWIRHGYELPTNYGLLPIESIRTSETLTYPAESSFNGRDRHRPQTHPRRNQRITASQVDQLLQSAIHDHLIADVPVGVFLSGGVDSALIAAIASTNADKPHCITIRMPDASFDESENAKETAEHLGVKHSIVDCDPSPADDLVHLIHQLGLPFGDSSLLPTYWVSKATRMIAPVALSGDGADELFGGYQRLASGRQIHLASFVPCLGRVLMLKSHNESDPHSKSAKIARAARAIRHAGYQDLISIFDEHDLAKLLSSPSRTRLDPMIRRPFEFDFQTYLPNDLLRKTDTAGMSVALEIRAPFLDPRVVEPLRSARLSTLMPNGQRKGLLKQVARKYLPDHIVDRPKQGFAIPIGEWFRTDYGNMRQLLLDHLRSSDPFPGLEEAGVNINMKFVEQMIREHDAAGEKSINPWHGRDHSQRLYMLLVLSIWSKWLHRIQSNTQQPPDIKTPTPRHG